MVRFAHQAPVYPFHPIPPRHTNNPATSQASNTTASSSGKITDWVKPGDTSGEFKRQQSSFRNWISREPGAQFPPEKGRYHLYVSYACPWVSYNNTFCREGG